VTINTNGLPFAVNGNSVAVLDPTAMNDKSRSAAGKGGIRVGF
jgi:hypothetical protein